MARHQGGVIRRGKWSTRLIIVVVLGLLLVLSGCTIRFLPDLEPDDRPRSTTPIAPPVIRSGPAVRFNGSAIVSLDGTLHNLRGDIFQALQSACGITRAEAKDKYGWPTAPAYDYGVEMWASTSWDAGISVVSISAIVSRLQIGHQRSEDVFVKNGTGSATYGEFYGAYGVRRVGMYRSADAATRFAAAAAIANLCGGTLLYRPRADIGVETPQEVPVSCVPPDCYEQTISIYGTWGGTGINSHWPARPAYAPPVRHHHHHSGGRGGGRRGR